MWCLGNELDGPWQLGHKTPAEYARTATETARAMRQFDPDLELVACGSSGSAMPTFGTWEAAVLGEAYPVVDFLSLHAYYEELDGDLPSFMGSAVDLDRFIEVVAATTDHAAALQHSPKRIQLSVDEWNVWYLSRLNGQLPTDWAKAPRLSEEEYTVADAVVVGSLLITLLKHADRVTCACLAQLVNTIAPIHAEPGGPAWRKTTFYPFSLTAAAARGSVLRIPIESPTFATTKYGDVPAVDAVATLDRETREATLFAVNRHPELTARLSFDVTGLGAVEVGHATMLSDDDVHARNSAEAPLRVVPRAVGGLGISDGSLVLDLPRVAWAVVTLALPKVGS
jgi:alpha-N-arabinofuranosidase